MQLIFLSSRIHTNSYCDKQCYPTILNWHKIFPLYLRIRNISLSPYTRIYLQMARGTSSNMAALLNSAKDMHAVMFNLARFYQNVSVSVYTNTASSRSNISYNTQIQFNTLTFWRYDFNTTNNLNRTTLTTLALTKHDCLLSLQAQVREGTLRLRLFPEGVWKISCNLIGSHTDW